jgi:hypothetical protein
LVHGSHALVSGFLWIWPDCQCFLMLKPKEQQKQTALTQITFVQNWFEELKHRVSTGTK